jgi:hypothetical protein
MKQNRFPTHLGRIAIIILFAALSFSVLGMPAASPVAAQEPTPTSDVSGQIVGGAPADPGEWPWQVALFADDGVTIWFCGGSLISPHWVLTAAHCVVDNGGVQYAPSAVGIVAGLYQLDTPAPGYQARGVTQIIVHPAYDNDTLVNDIALLKLASPVILGGSGETKTGVIPLVSASIGSLAGTNSMVTGWGDTESTPQYPNELHEVQLPIITNTLCQQSYGASVTSDMLCAGYAEGGKDACYGDSGGPLMVFVDGKWQLAGIVSAGYGCADPGYYSVYTRVSSFITWVDDYIPADLVEVLSIDVYSPDFDLDPSIYANDDVSVYVKVKNTSNVATGPFTVNLYVNGTPVDCSNENRDYYLNSAGLAAGQLVELTLTIPAGDLDIDDHSISAYADSGCVLDELNKSNNILTEGFTVNPIPVDAPAPVHDNVEDAKVISGYPYTHTVDVRGATRHASDPADMTCTIPNGTRVVDAGLASVWYQYTATSDTTLFVDTFGSNYDTYLAAWQGGIPGVGTLIGCNEDSGGVHQSALSVPVTNGTTYYFLVAQFSNDITNVEVEGASLDGKSSTDVEAQAGGMLNFRVREGAQVDVTIAGVNKGSYPMINNSTNFQSYATAAGPVKVTGSGYSIVMTERVLFSYGGGLESYYEMMGLPVAQLSTEYWYPYNTNAGVNTQIRFANAGNSTAIVEVWIAGNLVGTYNVSPNSLGAANFYDVVGGPVQVKSTNGVPIISTQRFILTSNGVLPTSFSETLGMPLEQLSTEYWFPFYNNLSTNTEVRIANIGNNAANVDIFIGGTKRGSTLSIPSNSTQLVSFDGLAAGPVRIVSTNAMPIVATERVLFSYGGGLESYYEMMGLPVAQLSTEYWYPYNTNAGVNTQIRFANAGNSTAIVEVWIAGNLVGTYNVSPNSLGAANFYDVVGGPVQVKSTNGVPIISTQRFILTSNGVLPTSFSETLGMPLEQLSTEYWIPFYNNLSTNSQLRFSIP